MLTDIPRRRILIAALAGAALAALGLTVASSHATSVGGKPPDILAVKPTDNRAAPLKEGVTYQASLFPIALRLTARGGPWWGDQFKGYAHGKALFGFAQAAHRGVKGAITIVTAYGATPSVAATIARLQTGGSHLPETNIGGTTWQERAPVKLAGYSGRQFDGEVWGKFGHTFIPFSPKTAGGKPPDYLRLEKGEAFRLVALNVRGKTVVVLLNSAELPADEFPAFLTSASHLLNTLRFPA
jgi:hypothetical protein